MSGQCFLPINYYPNEEYKLLISRKPLEIENTLLMDCCEKLFSLFDQNLGEMYLDSFSVFPKELRFIFFSLINVLQAEARMMRHSGVYGYNNMKLSPFTRYFIFFKWAYFPKSIETLKLTDIS